MIGRFVFREVNAEGSRHRCAVWLPPGYDAARAWPAILFLHGSGECGTDGERPIHEGLGPELAARPERWPFVVAFPQKASEEEEWEEREALPLAVCDTVMSEFSVDPKRVALVGMSQGGHGAWMLGARHPDRWSCLVVVCGYGRARTVAHRVAGLPIWAFHGLQDDIVDPAETRGILAGIREFRTRMGLDPQGARMTLYPGANHGSWLRAFKEPGLPAWIASQSRR